MPHVSRIWSRYVSCWDRMDCVHDRPVEDNLPYVGDAMTAHELHLLGVTLWLTGMAGICLPRLGWFMLGLQGLVLVITGHW